MRWNEIINEKANPTPSKFWMVFNMSRDDEENTAKQLADQTMHGVKGISASRVIVSNFLSTSGNACLVMDSKRVIEDNHLEMIDYTDPNYLCGNDMSAIYRLLNKKNDGGIGRYGLMQVLLGYAFSFLKKQDQYRHYYLHYHGLDSWAADIYKKDDVVINTPEEFCDYAYKIVIEAAEGQRMRDMVETTPQEMTEAAMFALSYVGKTYEDESEWMVRGDSLVIPSGSSLLLLAAKDVMAQFEEWKSGAFDPPSWKRWRFEQLDHAYEMIQKYDLKSVYRIRFIDEDHFSKINSAAKARRYERNRT